MSNESIQSSSRSMEVLVETIVQIHLDSQHCLLVNINGTEYDEAYGGLGFCLATLCESVEKNLNTNEPIEGFRITSNNEDIMSGTLSVDELKQSISLDTSKIDQWREENGHSQDSTPTNKSPKV